MINLYMSIYSFSGNREIWINEFFQRVKNHFDPNDRYRSITTEDLLVCSEINFNNGIVSKSGNREYWINNIIDPMLLCNDIDMISSGEVFDYLRDNNIISNSGNPQAGGRKKRRKRRKSHKTKKRRKSRKIKNRRKSRKTKNRRKSRKTKK